MQDYKKAFIFDGTNWVEVLEKPKNLTVPELSFSRGQELYGADQTVTATNGTWEGTVSSYKYQWQKGIYAGSQIDWSDITDATNNSFLIPGDLVGYKLRCAVTAVNNAGDSEKAYGTTIGIILPEFVQTITAFVQQDADGYVNGKIRVFWDVSEGADGYLLIYQGPGIARTEKKIIGKSNNLFDWDFGATNVNDLIGMTSLSIYVGPYNDTSSAAAAYRAANGIGDSQTPTFYQSGGINDLLPKKPTVTASAVAITPYVYDTAIQMSWSLSNITQSSFSAEYQYFNDETLEYGWAPYRSGTTEQSVYMPIGPGFSFDGLRVVVSGTSRGFAGPFIGVSNSPTSAYLAPAIYTKPFLTPSTNVQVGEVISATQGIWDYNPTSYTLDILKNGVSVASGTQSCSYTTVLSDADATFTVKATATNPGGTTESYGDYSIQCLNTSTVPANGIAQIYGTGRVGTQITMSTSGWTGNPTPSITTSLQRMNYSGGYDDMGVTSYTVQESDLSVGSKGGTIAAIFRARATASNIAGSTSAYSDYLQVSSNTFTVPSFLGGGVPQGTSNYTITNGGALYKTTALSQAGTVAAQYPTAGTTATIGVDITVYTYYYEAAAVLASGGVASISGSGQVGSTITASASGWSGSPTPTVTTQLQRMNYAGGYDDMGVTSYTVQSSDLSVGTKGGAIPQYFRAISRATNSAGTAEVYSDYVQASAAPVTPSFPFFPDFVAPPSFPYFPAFKGPSFPFFPFFPDFVAPPSFPYFPAFKAPSFPFFPDFVAAPSFPYFKVTKCIESNTRLLTFDRGYVAAKDIQLGDKLVSISAEDFGNESMKWFNIKDNVKLVEVEVVKSEMSVKDVLSFNGTEKYFSYGQPIFIKKDGLATWVESGSVNIGDTLLELDPGTGEINEVIVDSIQTDTDKEVYDIRTSGNQWFIAEQFIVIS